MPGSWIAVAAADHVAAAAREGFFVCAHGSGSAAARPALGDRFAYYAPRTAPGGEPVQAFVALGTILDAATEPHDFGDFRAAVRRADYERVRPAAVKPLLPRLGFVRDPAHWGMAFRQGLFAVSDADFAVIATALQDGADG